VDPGKGEIGEDEIVPGGATDEETGDIQLAPEGPSVGGGHNHEIHGALLLIRRKLLRV
jgi:hypothetical protein